MQRQTDGSLMKYLKYNRGSYYHDQEYVIAIAAEVLGQRDIHGAIPALLQVNIEGAGYPALNNQGALVYTKVTEALERLHATDEQIFDWHKRHLSSERNISKLAILGLGKSNDHQRAIHLILSVLQTGTLGIKGDDSGGLIFPPVQGQVLDVSRITLEKLGANKDSIVQAFLDFARSYIRAFFQKGGAPVNSSIEEVIEVLSELRDPRVVDFLLSLWTSPSLKTYRDRSTIRWFLRTAFGKLGNAKAIEPLLTELREESYYNLSGTVDILKKLNVASGRLYQIYIDALSSRYMSIRLEAAKALIAMGGYEHEDILKMLQGKTIMLLQEAIQLKQEGIKFEPIYRAAESYYEPDSLGYGGMWVEASPEVLYLNRLDKAMVVSPHVVLKSNLAQNGGIDLNQIGIKRTGHVIQMQFDPAQLNALKRGGFEGFTPVIINIQRISSPLALLGVNPANKPDMLARA